MGSLENQPQNQGKQGWMDGNLSSCWKRCIGISGLLNPRKRESKSVLPVTAAFTEDSTVDTTAFTLRPICKSTFLWKINAPGQFSSQGTQISYSCTASALGLHLKKLVTVVQLPHNLTPVRKEVNRPNLQNIRLSTRILGGRKESRSTTKSSSMTPSWPLTVGRSKFTSKRKCRHQTT